MSVASQNLFAVLDEDSSKASSRETKKTPTKKSEPAATRGARPASTKKPFSPNDAAFRDREIGRSANRGKTLEPKTDSNNRRTRTPKLDRHSRTGKVDSEKKIEKGWGDNKKELDDEVAGEAIAKADEAADAAEDAAAPADETPKTISLDEYLGQLSVQQKEISSEVSLRKANDGKDISGSVLKREEEDFVSASKLKKEKSKKPKEKVTLDVDPVFANPERRERSERPERRGNERKGNDRRGNNDRRSNNRGPKSANRSGPKSSGPRGAQQKTVDLSSKDEFPVLGA